MAKSNNGIINGHFLVEYLESVGLPSNPLGVNSDPLHRGQEPCLKTIMKMSSDGQTLGVGKNVSNLHN